MKALNICISALLLLTLGSCNDFLKETPQSFLTTEGAIQDKAFVEAQLMGAYKSLLLYRNDRGGFLGISGTDEAVGKTVEVMKSRRVKFKREKNSRLWKSPQ